MTFIVCGLNHRTAPIDVRERWALSADQSRRALHELCGRAESSEHVILSTCNRTEFYSHLPSTSCLGIDGQDSTTSCASSVYDLYSDIHRLSGNDDANVASSEVYVLREDQAIGHLFRLAAGVDSMIVGESQILKQIKDAFSVSEQEQAAGRFFRKLFPAALRAGKQVRTATRIGVGCLTPGQAAVTLSQQVLGRLDRCSALILGSGEIAELAAVALRDEVAECLVVNRTASRARDLVDRIGAGVAREWADLESCLCEVDLVIGSVSSREPVLGTEILRRVQTARQFRPLVLVDLAVPRNVEPSVEGIQGVHLFNLDDLNEVVAENVHRRHSQIPDAVRIVDTAVEAFLGQMRCMEIEPIIRHLITRFEQIRLGELQKALGDFPQEHHAAVNALSESLVKKLLHFPIQKLKTIRELDSLSPEEVAFLKRLFLSA